MQRGVEKWIGRAVNEPKSRQVNTEEGRKAVIEAKDCFVWKGMEEDGVT
jgi:hypothetical protein